MADGVRRPLIAFDLFLLITPLQLRNAMPCRFIVATASKKV
jgi:hypothetical protein